jgi:ribosomal protein S18 acetylase RimI-like enzyme
MATITYCKRLRMEVDLQRIDLTPPLPRGFLWVPWDNAVLTTHAEVMWHAFRREFDGCVFPNLAQRDGCLGLMKTIAEDPGFVGSATWLIAAADRCCGTVQGLTVPGRVGMIQNLGVVRGYRGQGLGRALLLKALHGFRQVGVTRVCLEVTARNTRAVRLYHQTGFVISKSSFRELAPTEDDSYFI